MKSTSDNYEFFTQLFRAHDAQTPSDYAKAAYDRTECGAWTAFVLPDGSAVPSADLEGHCDSIEYATRNFVGVQHGTIIEGSDAELSMPALLLPFTDAELADCWQALEDFADSQR